MEFTLVTEQSQLASAQKVIADADVIGMDTEFVAEDCYQPDLCLLQVSTRDEVFIVDPKALPDINPLWDLMVDGKRTVVVHAGREEILFAFRATGRPLSKLFDIQVATGLLGGEYPASYGKLLQRFMGETAPKGETRTDWRKRPLSKAQLDYAALDVLHLPEILDILSLQLTEAGRLDWLTDELERRQTNLLAVQEQEGWHRLSGVQSLQGKQLAIVRELWRWRDSRAQQKNMPARRVLRDDLIVELARRGVWDTKRISQIRGLHHSGFQRFLPEIADAIKVGTESDVPEAPWLGQNKRPRPPALLKQFLTAAMSYLCRTHSIAPAIVGTSDDVGRLATYWLYDKTLPEDHERFPNLLKGWRAELVGQPLYRIFKGEQALRVVDPRDEMPLGLCDAKEPKA
ncbi:MAG: HRDC domain-containing protein [Aureliella sp.]